MKQRKSLLWLNSLCLGGLWLHDYQITEQLENGVIEVCSRCRDRKYFPNNINNYTYLSYHLRSVIRPNNVRFNREFNK